MLAGISRGRANKTVEVWRFKPAVLDWTRRAPVRLLAFEPLFAEKMPVFGEWYLDIKIAQVHILICSDHTHEVEIFTPSTS